MYAVIPASRTVLNPEDIASIKAKIGARTEKQPFVARAHGTNFGLVLLSNERPRGKGTPMNTPVGMSMKKTSSSFIVREYEEIPAITTGRKRL